MVENVFRHHYFFYTNKITITILKLNAGGAFAVARLFSVLFVVGVEQRRRIHVHVDTDQRMLSGNIRRCYSRTQENLEVTKTHKDACYDS